VALTREVAADPRLRGDTRGRNGGFAKSWRRDTKNALRRQPVEPAAPRSHGRGLHAQSLWNIMAGCLTKTKRSIAWL